MTDVRTQIGQIARRLAPLCRDLSVRHDERGAFIFAIAEDDTHSLELWYQNGELSLELWHGKSAEVERIVESPRFRDAAAAECSSALLRATMPSSTSIERARER